MKNLPEGQYNFKSTEEKIMNFWLSKPFFKPEYSEENTGTYTMVLPPPNANGSLHIGHISGYVYQDLMGRYQRLKGKKVLLLPGKDHAGIQTEVVFERKLEAEGLKKQDIGRDKFYKMCYDFCIEMSQNARSQEKRIGLSADYDRELFTLDPRVVDTVLSTFIELYKDGYVYKGTKTLNWCVRDQTTLADIDTEHKERDGVLTYIKYKLKDTDKYITVATSRPETLLGDTALAVNPDDERYTELNGKIAVVPLVDREVPIISSRRVEKEFGAGVLKLTPSHALDDAVIASEYERETGQKIDSINVIWKDGKLSGPIPEKYKGLKVNASRAEIVKDLKEMGLIEKEENIKQNVVICERCKSVIEPLMTSQWFINVNEIKKPAISAVKEGKVKIYPQSKEKEYIQWMDNLREWPVSRQLWWGYRIPVWYKGEKQEFLDDSGKVYEKINGKVLDKSNFDELVKVSLTAPGSEWIQDPDIFDTWFSSGQWPYATLMARPGDFEAFYPPQVMETGYDILFLWVSRMIMLGIYKTGKVPFNTVYLHGLVTDMKGQKMSKSKNNGIDPEHLIETYGTDALRFSFMMGNAPGQNYPLYDEKVKGFRNFNNKIWNASKFVMKSIEDLDQDLFHEVTVTKSVEDLETLLKKHEIPLLHNDTDMLGVIKKLENDYDVKFEKLRFGQMAEDLYDSFWHEFCDKYIEFAKEQLKGDEIQMRKIKITLLYILKVYLIFFHPYIPFITEEIWQHLIENGKFETAMMYSQI